jgi:hypothetical protein
VRVLVNVLIKPDVFVNPEAVDFGQVDMGAINKNPSLLRLLIQTFVVQAREGEIEIKSITSDLAYLDIKKSPQGKANTFRIDVSLPPLVHPGPISGSIRIATSHPKFPEIAIPVRGEIK